MEPKQENEVIKVLTKFSPTTPSHLIVNVIILRWKNGNMGRIDDVVINGVGGGSFNAIRCAQKVTYLWHPHKK